jgi:hypothetical protein
MKSDNWIAISELGEEIVRLVNCNTYNHLSAPRKRSRSAKHSATSPAPSIARSAAKSSTPAETASWLMT